MRGEFSVDAGSSTLVARTARALSDLSMAHDEGCYLGSEDELLALNAYDQATQKEGNHQTQFPRKTIFLALKIESKNPFPRLLV